MKKVAGLPTKPPISFPKAKLNPNTILQSFIAMGVINVKVGLGMEGCA
jgi:hypothetical protein